MSDSIDIRFFSLLPHRLWYYSPLSPRSDSMADVYLRQRYPVLCRYPRNIHCSVRIHNIQLRPHQQTHAIHLSGNHIIIHKIKQTACLFQLRRMLRNRQAESFRSRTGHFRQSAVGMAAGYCTENVYQQESALCSSSFCISITETSFVKLLFCAEKYNIFSSIFPLSAGFLNVIIIKMV